MPYLHLEMHNSVAVVWLDQEGEKVNKLGAYLLDEFATMLSTLGQDNRIIAVVLISRKVDSFIVGADLDELAELKLPGEVEKLVRAGQELLQRLDDFPKPVVAAVHGAALGGGLEVALACDYRICSDSPKTIFGLPEVKLGLLPGAGGTQRLPRLIGIQRALDILLTGKNVYPVPAKKMGLVDLIVSEHALLDSARKAALNLVDNMPKRKPRLSLFGKALEKTPLRKIIFNQARKIAAKQTGGHYPAPAKIISCVQKGISSGMAAGLLEEANSFEKLTRSPQSVELRQLFFSITDKKKNPLTDQVKNVKTIGIVGAGLMGSGIANVSINSSFRAVLKDISIENVARGQKMIYYDLDRKVRKKVISSFQRDVTFNRLSGQTDYRGFKSAEVVVEAVFEDLSLKHRILSEVEAATDANCIFASNTSSLPIGDIAAKAQRPQNVIGMHYFSPVPKMPLLEIIITPQTSDWVTATAVDVGIKQGKTVIVVKDGPGFYTTRILAPMLNEALLLLAEGGDIAYIDRTMKRFGFPVGPLTLIDEVGIDVGAHVSDVLSGLFAGRGAKTSDVMAKLVDDGLLGRKNQKGFYHYELDKDGRPGKNKEVNQSVYKYFGGMSRREHPPFEVQDRLLLMMVNEAMYCLGEGIITSPQDGDLGAILGLGFPPFLGGPFRYADSTGAEVLLKMLQEYQKQCGPRFTPAPILSEMVNTAKKFY
ncbi:MAG: 3-hydroxyacyl-CoA dehydrogenase NAD-binding domain-containing protein [Calditrichia bacterium]